MRMSTVPHALAAGLLAGFLMTTLPACGPGQHVARCSASNCAGCCDDTGLCQNGVSLESCGKNGSSCAPCSVGQSCVPADQTNTTNGGICIVVGVTGGGAGSTGGGSATTGGGSGTTGGGSATTGGGSATTGGGSATTGGGSGTTGGGSATTGGGSGTTGGGSATTGGGAGTTGGGTGNGCATCLTASGTCVASNTPARCGSNGVACVSCGIGSTCVAGACQACAGCVDPTTGECKTGNTASACGSAGDFCRTCDSTQSETCTSNACVASGNGSCNTTNCDGCCDNGAPAGQRCKHPGNFTQTQCGSGTAGAQCVSCASGQTCNTDSASLRCEGGGTSTDGGFPTGFFCDPSDPTSCPGGCCDGDPQSGIGTCVVQGDSCVLSPLSFAADFPFGCGFAQGISSTCVCTCGNDGLCHDPSIIACF